MAEGEEGTMPVERLRLLRDRAALVIALLTLAAAGAAQNVSGTILGTVRDDTGGGVPRAVVTLTHETTGYARTLDADDRSDFSAPLLATGEYALSATAPGFKPATITGIALGVDQRVRVDVTLAVGDVADAVTVRAGNPLVQGTSSDLSATFDERRVQDLPLNGRNFVPLARTLPGVGRGVPGENIDGASAVAWRHSASFTVNGQRNRDNTFLLDGLDNNDAWLNAVAIFPNVDALDEIKVQTGIYAAEFGRSLGGVVSLQTRAGSNVVRGGAFEFLRNDRLDANDWFNARAGRPRPELSQHQFGGTLGGPVVRNRTFFFGSYQGWNLDQGLTLISTVPTEAMRRGDFSELRRVIHDPRTGAPFPGNVIPPDRIDPVARRVLDELYPVPNAAGRRAANGQIIDNYVANPTQTRDDHQFDLRNITVDPAQAAVPEPATIGLLGIGLAALVRRRRLRW
jgi:hypothetical protein